MGIGRILSASFRVFAYPLLGALVGMLGVSAVVEFVVPGAGQGHPSPSQVYALVFGAPVGGMVGLVLAMRERPHGRR